MFLSKVLIRGAACRNPYEIHRALWNFFAEDANARRDFLFRIVQAELIRAEILMQSIRRPEQLSPNVRILACKEYQLSLQTDQRLRFYLVANPVKTIDDEDGRENAQGDPKKCRVPLVTDEDRRTWIDRKLQNVAALETAIIEPGLPIRFKKGKENRAGKIQPVSFLGIITVKDAQGLSELVRNGIGPAKAFGCGMLSLARA